MSRAKRAADRIRECVSLVQVLSDYGYEVEPQEYEQQFSCDLHGDGRDSKPSARVYPDSGQFFCFACGRSRDVITLVREKEGITFYEAVRKLEHRFGLDPLPWEDEEEKPLTAREQVEASLRVTESSEQTLNRLNSFLLNLCREKSLEAHKCVALWEAYDRIVLWKDQGKSEPEICMLALKVLASAKEALTKPF